MAGLAAAWRLSEPGWQDELESITVYQRGWRLGGKGASSRGPNGRIEEHGLHLWLGYYENAFRLLRECYAELDRPRDRSGGADPDLARRDVPRRHGGARGPPRGRLAPLARPVHAERPAPGRARRHGARAHARATSCAARSQLIVDFLDSLPDDATASGAVSLSRLRRGARRPEPRSSTASASRCWPPSSRRRPWRGARWTAPAWRPRCGRSTARSPPPARRCAGLVEDDADLRRTWHLVAVMTAVVRGMLADGIVTGSRGFRALNDEDFLDWIARHGAPPEVADFAFIRGLYDLVFADGGRRAIAARGERRASRSS